MIDPGFLAALIYGGVGTFGLLSLGVTTSRHWRRLWRLRRATRTEARTPWTTHREHRADGSIVLSIQRRSQLALYARETVRELPAGTSELDVDVARWEAKNLASERNQEEGRRERS